jgi:hypothetical protein
MNIKQGFVSTVEWIKEDYQSNQIRFFLEAIAWIISIGCTIAVAVYAPYPPMFVLYPFFILQCAIFAYCAWTRNSMGMFANYLLISTIDLIGLIKIWVMQ